MIAHFFRMRVNVRIHPSHIELVCSGIFSRPEASRVITRAYQEAATAGRNNVLIDVRGVKGRLPSIFERFDIGVHVAERFLEQQPRVRLALLGHEPMIHPERFGEIVARNRGADTRVFTVEADAVDWLLMRMKAK
jgi:hypothetical protein